MRTKEIGKHKKHKKPVLRKRSAARSDPRDPSSVRQRLARIFLKRSYQLLQDLTAKAPPDVIEAALDNPDPVGGVAGLLSTLVADGSRVEIDPMLEAIAKGVGLKSELLRQAGGTWSATKVAEALRMSRQAVDKRRARHALLAVPSGAGDYLYPRCQFTPQGVIPDIERVLRAFRVDSPWTQLSGLLASARTLGGKSPLAALRAGDVDGAVQAVASIGDTLDEDAPVS